MGELVRVGVGSEGIERLADMDGDPFLPRFTAMMEIFGEELAERLSHDSWYRVNEQDLFSLLHNHFVIGAPSSLHSLNYHHIAGTLRNNFSGLLTVSNRRERKGIPLTTEDKAVMLDSLNHLSHYLMMVLGDPHVAAEEIRPNNRYVPPEVLDPAISAKHPEIYVSALADMLQEEDYYPPETNRFQQVLRAAPFYAPIPSMADALKGTATLYSERRGALLRRAPSQPSE